jgi:hypothetical protein
MHQHNFFTRFFLVTFFLWPILSSRPCSSLFRSKLSLLCPLNGPLPPVLLQLDCCHHRRSFFNQTAVITIGPSSTGLSSPPLCTTSTRSPLLAQCLHESLLSSRVTATFMDSGLSRCRLCDSGSSHRRLRDS